MSQLTAQQALDELKAGNHRFVSDQSKQDGQSLLVQQQSTAGGQKPFAIILGCSDSRVPAELIFDQGVGDIFIIRVAGNVVSPEALGSIEYALQSFGTALVVVLGHSSCGAVDATLQTMAAPESIESDNLRSITDRIRPAIAPLDLAANQVQEAVDANILHAVSELTEQSAVIQDKVASGDVQVLGACYDLSTGRVTLSS